MEKGEGKAEGKGRPALIHPQQQMSSADAWYVVNYSPTAGLGKSGYSVPHVLSGHTKSAPTGLHPTSVKNASETLIQFQLNSSSFVFTALNEEFGTIVGHQDFSAC